MVALGPDIAGAMGNDDALVDEIVATAAAVGEPAWALPLYADYRAMIESKVADIKNIGKRWGGAITAGLFLAEFVGDTPWVHMDIAGPAFQENATDLGPAGATGVPVRTLVRFLEIAPPRDERRGDRRRPADEDGARPRRVRPPRRRRDLRRAGRSRSGRRPAARSTC